MSAHKNCLLSALFSLLLTSSALADQIVHLTPVSTGIADKMGGSLYMALNLSTDKPAAIKKLPNDLSDHVEYGIMNMQGMAGNGIAVVLDSPEGKPARLFVDSNGDGDLTNDPATEWTSGPEYKGKLAGLKPDNLAYCGSATVKLGSPEQNFDAQIGLWQYDSTKMRGQTPKQLEELRHTLRYFRDYAMTGRMTVGDKEHNVMLLDELATGNFKPTGAHPLVRLYIDLNDNGKLDSGDMFDIAKPFKINGSVYEVADPSPDGRTFRYVPSDKPAYSPDDVKVGQIAPTFTATDIAGNTIKFPETYKGKILMLDFWATWCRPCMAEVPNVVSAYKKYHDQGFEILGITLDEAEAGDHVKEVTAKQEITWPQLFGKPGNRNHIQEMFSVTMIPSAFLIDGTTGKILASGNDLRGEGLEKALAKFVHVVGEK